MAESITKEEPGSAQDRIQSEFVIKPAKTVQEAPEVFSCAYSPDDAQLACSYADGAIRVFNASTGAEEFALNRREDSLPNAAEAGEDALSKAMRAPTFPTTQIKWRPAVSESKTKNVLISVNSDNDGLVQHWHIRSGKCLHTIEEPGNF